MDQPEQSNITLIDAFNNYWVVWEGGNRRSLNASVGLYFYLVKIWNVSGRPISFRHQNNTLIAALGMSQPTFLNQRNTLKQYGLIDFFSKGKGDPDIYYQLKEVKNFNYPAGTAPKKLKNLTTDFTTDFTTDLTYKQSTEPELFLIINKEVKNFNYLLDLFSQDPGLQMQWKGNGFPVEQFADGVQQWMILHHTTPYTDFNTARKHFLFWLPNYHKIIENERTKEIKRRSATGTGNTKDDSDRYAKGF